MAATTIHREPHQTRKKRAADEAIRRSQPTPEEHAVVTETSRTVRSAALDVYQATRAESEEHAKQLDEDVPKLPGPFAAFILQAALQAEARRASNLKTVGDEMDPIGFEAGRHCDDSKAVARELRTEAWEYNQAIARGDWWSEFGGDLGKVGRAALAEIAVDLKSQARESAEALEDFAEVCDAEKNKLLSASAALETVFVVKKQALEAAQELVVRLGENPHDAGAKKAAVTAVCAALAGGYAGTWLMITNNGGAFDAHHQEPSKVLQKGFGDLL